MYEMFYFGCPPPIVAREVFRAPVKSTLGLNSRLHQLLRSTTAAKVLRSPHHCSAATLLRDFHRGAPHHCYTCLYESVVNWYNSIRDLRSHQRKKNGSRAIMPDNVGKVRELWSPSVAARSTRMRSRGLLGQSASIDLFLFIGIGLGICMSKLNTKS